MGRKSKYSDYFGNRFDDLGTAVRKFKLKKNRAVLAMGLIVGLSAMAGLGYLVFSGTNLGSPEQTTTPFAPVQQEFARRKSLSAPAMSSASPARHERVQKLINPKKKVTKQKNKRSKKIVKSQRAQKQNLICIDPARLKTMKKGKVASSKRH